MDEQQVRALVRQAIAKHMGRGAHTLPTASAAPAIDTHTALHAAPLPHAPGVQHRAPQGPDDLDISHARFHLVRGPGEVECLIEPTVACNHCGFCQTYGH